MHTALSRFAALARFLFSLATLASVASASSYPVGYELDGALPATASPTLASPLLAKVVRGLPLDYAVPVSDATSLVAAGLPAGLSIPAGSFAIRGVPAVEGTFAVVLTATNAGGSTVGTLVLLVVPPAPVITSALSAPGWVGQVFNYALTATDSPTKRTAAPLPPGLSMNETTGVISGTPTATGVFPVQVAAQNDGGTTAATLLITVGNPAVAPQVPNPQLAKAVRGVPFSYFLQAAGATSYTATGLPAGLALDLDRGEIVGTPSVTGDFAIPFTATNAVGATSGTLVLLVVPATPAITLTGPVGLTVGVPFSLVVAVAPEFDSVAAQGLPPGLSVAGATGIVSGTPTVAGDFSVALVATNAGGQGLRTVVFRVAESPGPRFFSGLLSNGNAGTSIIVTPGGVISFFAFDPATGVTAIEGETVIAPDGSFELSGSAISVLPPVAPLPASPVVRGRFQGATVSGEIVGTAVRFTATRSLGAGAGAIYRVGIGGDADGTAYTVIAPGGDFQVFIDGPVADDFARGVKTAGGAFPAVVTHGGATFTVASVTPTALSGSYAPAADAPVAPIGGLPIEAVPARYLANLSARAFINGNVNPAIVGFVVKGSKKAKVLLRAAGPALAALGVTDPIADPRLVVYDATGKTIAENNDWGTATPAVGPVATALGAFDFPTGGKDSAIVIELEPGVYSAAAYAGVATERGVVLIEVYDGDPAAVPGKVVRLVNSSSRAWVEEGDHAIISGLVITGNYPKRVVVRGIGPTLAGYKVTSPLVDPRIALYRSGGDAPIASNDDWWNGNSVERLEDAFAQVGAFPLADFSGDGAFVVTLEPGAYTVVVSARPGFAGNALVEVYEADLTP